MRYSDYQGAFNPGLSGSRDPTLLHISCVTVSKFLHHPEIPFPYISEENLASELTPAVSVKYTPEFKDIG